MRLPRPTTFEQGVASSEYEFFRRFPRPDQITFTTFCDDLHFFDRDHYRIFETQAGVPTYQSIDTFGGGILITNSGALNDIVMFQLPASSFAFTPQRRTWFSTRLSVIDSGRTSLFAGLTPTTNDPYVATDAVGFFTENTIPQLNFKSIATGVGNTLMNLAPVGNDQPIFMSFYFDGVDLFVYLNGDIIASIKKPTTPLNFVNLTIALKNLTASPQQMFVDWVFSSWERPQL